MKKLKYDGDKVMYYTNTQHYLLKNKITAKLQELWNHKSFITIPGVDGIFLERLGFEEPKRMKSILNYLNTNILFRSFIAKEYGVQDFDSLIEAFKKNSYDLISEEGKHFKQVLDLLKKTEDSGIKTEMWSANIIKEVMKKKFNLDITPHVTNPDSYDDMIEGIDIFFTSEERTSTVQVKPYQSFRKIKDQIWIENTGLNKRYWVNFMFFANRYTNQWIMFFNRPLDDECLKFKLIDVLDTNLNI